MTTATDFGAWVRSELSARLAPRHAGDAVSVLGAGNDDLEAGRRYLTALSGSGLAIPSWPREYGGLAASADEVAIVRRELAAYSVPDLYAYLVGVELIGPTLLAVAYRLVLEWAATHSPVPAEGAPMAVPSAEMIGN